MVNTTLPTFMAVIALASAQQELHAGVTHLDPLEVASMKVQDSSFVEEVRDCYNDHSTTALDSEFEEFRRTLNEDDVALLAAAIAADIDGYPFSVEI
jgi:hypothetical protein